MNAYTFTRLLWEIYKAPTPNIRWIEKQGLLAVKIGQTFALRIDFLDAERCAELSKLYRATTIIPAEEATKQLDQLLTPEQKKRIVHIDAEPLASASVGQVHRARLDTGEAVIVKFVKSDFRKKFSKDVRRVKQLLRFAIFFYPPLADVADPIGALEHIEEYTINELNLLHEVEGQKKLRNIYESNKNSFALDALRFPHIYEELCSENVLVAQELTGKTVDELLNDGVMKYEQLLELFHVHGFFLFGPGVFHGDIHSGNIVLQDEHIYFIDTGAIGHVGDTIRYGLFQFMKALSFYDFPTCAAALNQMAERQISGEAYTAFEKKFLKLYDGFENSTVSEVSLTQQMMYTIKLGVLSGMRFEKGMFSIIKSMMYLDGMVLRCKPDAVLMRDMRPYVEEFDPFVKQDSSVYLKNRS